ncbi:MAG: Bor family protein [Gemmatimonadales bacterium]
MRAPRFTVIALTVLLGACYHATIDTGKTPSPTTVEKQWASSWIFGLVPPSTVETAAQCPSGVARVETQLSFVNQLVSLLTLGIYTPMDIRVTCAAASGAMVPAPTGEVVNAAATGGNEAALAVAVERSRRTGRPVSVDFRE